jgi:hypothetical protein
MKDFDVIPARLVEHWLSATAVVAPNDHRAWPTRRVHPEFGDWQRLPASVGLKPEPAFADQWYDLQRNVAAERAGVKCFSERLSSEIRSAAGFSDLFLRAAGRSAYLQRGPQRRTPPSRRPLVRAAVSSERIYLPNLAKTSKRLPPARPSAARRLLATSRVRCVRRPLGPVSWPAPSGRARSFREATPPDGQAFDDSST